MSLPPGWELPPGARARLLLAGAIVRARLALARASLRWHEDRHLGYLVGWAMILVLLIIALAGALTHHSGIPPMCSPPAACGVHHP